MSSPCGVGYRRWSGYGGIERSGGIEEGTDEEAAPTLGLKLHVLHASTEREFEPAFAALKQTAGGWDSNRAPNNYRG